MEILTDQKTISKVLDVRYITENTFVLRIERNRIKFDPGQHMVIGFPGEMENREYSIYSSVKDDFIEFLIKEVDDGKLSKRLKLVESGTELQIQGPYGYFVIPEHDKNKQEYVFVASGTGIAPFHSMIMSNPELNYQLLHGIRKYNEAYDSNHYPIEKHNVCVSQDSGNYYYGRVTQYLKEKKFPVDAVYYLCGNSSMIDEVLDILHEKGVDAQNIRTEVYF